MQDHIPTMAVFTVPVRSASPTALAERRPSAPVCPTCGGPAEERDAALQRWLDLSA
jgi:hypothetical protein